ncbi:low-density lipoprotein receptor-related protein 1B isoform X2 [Daktulosphaira vitifoliae]|nr:low-density lipoprotein receptor-related protein 1B isoform X2 [Daktulosphaira vitifoliae]
MCLQSTLLGFECMIDEQCSMKVANSKCLNNVCQCDEKFWQYRRHTCLSPAKLGDVCYSDMHCELSNKSNKCKFTIPGVFGFCVCNSLIDCSTDVQESVIAKPVNSVLKYPFGKPDLKKKVPYFKRTTTSTTTSSTSIKPLLIRPFLKTNKTNGLKLSLNQLLSTKNPIFSNASLNLTSIKSPVKNNFKINIKDTQEINQTDSKSKEKPNTSPILRKGDSKKRTSLGYECFNDAQCMQNDVNSRCIQGMCDCQHRNQTNNSQCSAKNRGCLPNTFQCRSSGKCISWFFVCDGRKGDCGEDDISDEECSGIQQCPSTSFKCRSADGLKNICVSRSTRCDGVRNCPYGDDEEDCKITNNEGCPPYTFQCDGGKCLPEYELCNAVVTCADKSDEREDLCVSGIFVSINKTVSSMSRVRGPPDQCPFRCKNGRCRSTAVLCSGRDGCGDGSDEFGCSVCKCPAVTS